jgi:hypothetical protein
MAQQLALIGNKSKAERMSVFYDKENFTENKKKVQEMQLKTLGNGKKTDIEENSFDMIEDESVNESKANRQSMVSYNI